MGEGDEGRGARPTSSTRSPTSSPSCDWTDEIDPRPAIEALGLKPGKVMHVLYTAIEGRGQGLPLFDSINLLGRESALYRLRAARARL